MRGRPEVETTVCAQCGAVTWVEDPKWRRTVNLTPDVLFTGFRDIGFGAALVDQDIAFDWCDMECFGRWLFRAAYGMQARQR